MMPIASETENRTAGSDMDAAYIARIHGCGSRSTRLRVSQQRQWIPSRLQRVSDGIAAAIGPLGINKEHVMNTKAIIASLVVLGSSSVAMASPSVTFSADASYGTTVVRDHRGPSVEPYYHREGNVWRGRQFAQRPVLLASDLQFARDGRTFITVGDHMGRFGTLQITAGAGRTLIKQVYVQFENGQEQVIRNLDRMLLRHQSLTLDLNGRHRAIKRIVVYGDDLERGGWRSWRRGGGTFSVTAL
jgi:hypothetical protein